MQLIHAHAEINRHLVHCDIPTRSVSSNSVGLQVDRTRNIHATRYATESAWLTTVTLNDLDIMAMSMLRKRILAAIL